MTLFQQAADPYDNYQPWSPDGRTWRGDWPPEVWLVKWRLYGLGYRQVRKAQLTSSASSSRQIP